MVTHAHVDMNICIPTHVAIYVSIHITSLCDTFIHFTIHIHIIIYEHIHTRDNMHAYAYVIVMCMFMRILVYTGMRMRISMCVVMFMFPCILIIMLMVVFTTMCLLTYAHSFVSSCCSCLRFGLLLRLWFRVRVCCLFTCSYVGVFMFRCMRMLI